MALDRLNQVYHEAVDRYQAGDLATAEKHARKLVKKAPSNANALNLLAVIVQQQGNLNDAIQLFERVCRLEPKQLQAHINLGNALRQAGQKDRARKAYEVALEHDSSFVAAKINLGTVLQESGNYAGALEQFSGAAKLSPEYLPAFYNLGVCYRDMRHFDEALAALSQAIAINPADPGSYFERANVLSDINRDEDAIADIETALRLKPEWPDALGNWASFLTNLDRHDEALEKFNKSLALDPSNMTNAVNRGLAFLAKGDLENGWPGYLKRAESSAPFYSKFEHELPHWEGQDVSDQRVLVWTEQALGDQILYAGLMEEFSALAGDITWVCPTKTLQLFRQSFAGFSNVAVTDESVSELALNDFDCHASMVDLAAYLRPSLDDFPRPKAYLKPDLDAANDLRAALRGQFSSDVKFVGLSWTSMNPIIGDGKSIDLEDLSPLLDIPGIQFVNVQYGPAGQDLQRQSDGLAKKIHTVDQIDRDGPLQESLNLLAALDLFISCSNTTAHLSAAAGLPTWIFVPAGKARIWYWFMDGAESPWYHNARLLRRSFDTPWLQLISEAAGLLKKYII